MQIYYLSQVYVCSSQDKNLRERRWSSQLMNLRNDHFHRQYCCIVQWSKMSDIPLDHDREKPVLRFTLYPIEPLCLLMAQGGWRSRRDGAEESKPRGKKESQSVFSPQVWHVFPKNKGFCDYYTPISRALKCLLLSILLSFIVVFCREKFSDCLTWL